MLVTKGVMRMTTLRRMEGWTLLLTVWAALASGVGPAIADISRSCIGTLSINSGGNDVEYEFTIPVTVANRLYANQARERSREAIISCVQEHWAMRMTDNRPHWCNEGGNYPFQAFSQEMTAAICAANPGQQSFTVNVSLRVHGDTGCFRERYVSDWGVYDIARDYRVYCSAPREHLFQNTDLPGGDYDHFAMRTTNYEECLKACNQQDRCQAWTFVRPRGGDPAVCWLKDRVPESQSSACCTSGTKGEVLR